MEDNKPISLDETLLADNRESIADSCGREEPIADFGAQSNTDSPATPSETQDEGKPYADEGSVTRKRFSFSGKTDTSVTEEPRKRRDGLGYAITGGVLLLISAVMLAVLISSFSSAAALIASLSPDRGYVGISVIVAIMVTIISAVGCIMASLALLYISSLALSRSEGVFKYISIAQMSISILFILASIILSILIISMA